MKLFANSEISYFFIEFLKNVYNNLANNKNTIILLEIVVIKNN